MGAGRRDLAWLGGLGVVLLVVMLWPYVVDGYRFGVGPDVPVYLWWTRVGASEGLSMRGEPPGCAGARGGARRHALVERRRRHGGARVRARGGDRGGRRGAGSRRRRPHRRVVAPGGAPRGRLLRASRRRVPREPGARRDVPGRGGLPGRRTEGVVGSGAPPRGWRPGASAVPRARDRRVARSRRARVAGGRPRRGQGHRSVRSGRRPRRGRGRARHDRRPRSDRRPDLEGWLPPPGGTRP